jgi:hypothetical protein
VTPGDVALVLGAGWSAAAGWPDTSAILDRDAWHVTRAQGGRYQRVWDCYGRWQGGDPTRTGDLFMKAVRSGQVSEVDWPSVVEVIAGTLASVGARPTSFGASPRYAESLMRPNRFRGHRDFVRRILDAGRHRFAQLRPPCREDHPAISDAATAHTGLLLRRPAHAPGLRWTLKQPVWQGSPPRAAQARASQPLDSPP